MDYIYRGNRIVNTTNGYWKFYLTKDMEDIYEFGPYDQSWEAERAMDKLLDEDPEWLRDE